MNKIIGIQARIAVASVSPETFQRLSKNSSTNWRKAQAASSYEKSR